MAAKVAVSGSHEERQPSGLTSHPPVPGSPTLTNPDMILPDYDPPDSPHGRSQSPLMLWQDPNIVGLDFQLPPQGHASVSTPIIYGNGTMLSDIGEVTEVESTVGPSSRRASSRYSAHTDDEITPGPLPPTANQVIKTRSKILSRDRRSSIESTSTITTQDQRNAAADFDDSASVGDSNFQGDDEESMASEYVEGTIPSHLHHKGSAQDLNENGNSLSHRAEQILANAKRRLTAMEDNLTRARSSLAYSPMSDYSTPSPQLGRPSTALRDPINPILPTHARMKSEDAIRGKIQPAPFPKRSASALGAAGGYRQFSASQKRDTTSARQAPILNKISHHPLDTTLEPLSEDDDDVTPMESARSSVFSNYMGPSFGPGPDKEQIRCASAAQVRDLQDQMHDLKGKISTLKEQARADSMKRRSLQSLRTPSPFTHARWDQGYTEHRNVQLSDSAQADGVETAEEGGEHVLETRDVSTPDANPRKILAQQDGTFTTREQETEDSPSEYSPDGSPTGQAQQTAPTEQDQSVEPGIEEAAAAAAAVDVKGEQSAAPQAESVNDDGENEEDIDEPEDVPDWSSDGGDSQYHDTFQNMVSHEDREDAFDYEHFFLHSAMGSLSRSRASRRDSSGSECTEESVETTRGPPSSMSRRRPSVDTNASEDSFATATEGRASRSSAFKAENGYDEYSVKHRGTYQAHNALLNNVYGGKPTGDGNAGNGDGANYQEHPGGDYVPGNAAHKLHRPSISSFESTGTTRSFPLVNKTKLNGGVLTPGGSPDQEAKQLSNNLMKDTATVYENGSLGSGGSTALAVQGLSREDQIGVERLIASLGKCVLGLGEASRASTEARLYRRRIDEARRILAGDEELQ